MENKALGYEVTKESDFCVICNPSACITHNEALELLGTWEIMKVNSEDVRELHMCEYNGSKLREVWTERIAERSMVVKDTPSIEKSVPVQHRIEEIPVNIQRRTEIKNNSSRIMSPFRSPITPNAVNLRAKPKENNTECIPCSLDNVFLDDKDGVLGRHKRKSSLAAEAKIKKQIIDEANDPNKEECFVKSTFESMFWGISKPKRTIVKPSGDSAIAGIFNITNKNVETRQHLTEHQGVLHDVTNSPSKQTASINKKELPSFNTRFFLDGDILIENEETCQDTNQPESESVDDANTSQYLPGRRYYKEREINTKLNEGYSTVETKKRAVIEIFSCPKTFFRKSTRERTVYFTTTSQDSVHNINGQLKPIVVEPVEPSFKWNGEKEIVEIVRRIELGVETTQDDFIFRKVDKGIEL